MLISELAEKTGVSAKTIRYYESIDVLPAPERLDNGYRDYDQEDVERLWLGAGARRLDFSLDDIQEILAMGGTCVNVGCIPSKALIRAMEHHHDAGLSPFQGVQSKAGDLDWGRWWHKRMSWSRTSGGKIC